MKRQRGVHDRYDRKKQSVKMTDIFGVEKVWGAAYENNRQHEDVSSKKVTCFHIAYYRGGAILGMGTDPPQNMQYLGGVPFF